MQIVFSEKFLLSYDETPAGAPGRLDPVVEELRGYGGWVEPSPASRESILLCHTPEHVRDIERRGLHKIASLAAGAAVRAAELAADEPAFALVRPPGHHASAHGSWGFCYYNNLAVALSALHAEGRIERALVVDFDLHHGDGTVNILGAEPWVTIHNADGNRQRFLSATLNAIEGFEGDCIAVSAGFDNHVEDWGGIVRTEDYGVIGQWAGRRARQLGARLFGVLEGGYNARALAACVRAFVEGMDEGWTTGQGAGPGHPE